jgi:S-adenosylmethionine decarboxylase
MCGVEWVIEAHGCVPSALAQLEKLEALFAYLVTSLNLHPIGPANWHQFPVTGGVTGLQWLAESHLACHTFPEYGSLCLNIFCCRPRPACDVKAVLERDFGAASVQIRKLQRRYTGER